MDYRSSPLEAHLSQLEALLRQEQEILAHLRADVRATTASVAALLARSGNAPTESQFGSDRISMELPN